MSEESNLTINQQHILNKYLLHHFGTRICIWEIELRSIGNDCVKYENFSIKYNNEKILSYFRSPYAIFKNIFESKFENMSPNELNNILKIEVIIKCNHGKGSFTMIMTIIVWYKQDSSYKNNYTDIIIREICSTKDKYEILHPLLSKL